MALYRRKPTIVDAEQFLDKKNPPRGVRYSVPHEVFLVTTMTGSTVAVSVGEWIVAEPDGEHYYPIADTEFKRIYEGPVERVETLMTRLTDTPELTPEDFGDKTE